MGATILETLNEISTTLAALDTQDELTILGDKIDALALRIAPENASLQATLDAALISSVGVPYMSSLVTAIQDGNVELNSIADALSPLSELQVLSTIAGAIRQCCGDDKYDSDIIPDYTYPPCDAEKCRRVKLILGQIDKLMDELAYNVPSDLLNLPESIARMSISALITKIIIPMIATTAEAANAVGMIYFFAQIIYNDGLYGMRLKFQAIRPELLCAYYDAATIGEGKVAAIAIVNASDMTGLQKQLMIALLQLVNYLGAPFIKENIDIDAFFDRLEGAGMGDWYPGDCYECEGCGGSPTQPCDDTTCEWIVGTPNLLDGCVPYDGDVSSEVWGSNNRVEFRLPAIYRFRVEILSSSVPGRSVQVAVYDCDGTYIEETNIDTDAHPVVDGFEGARLRISDYVNTPTEFTVNIKFTVI